MALPIGESFTQILNLLRARQDVNTNPGSVINDLFLTPAATESTRAKLLSTLVSYLQSLDGILFLKEPSEVRSQIIEALETTESIFDSMLTQTIELHASNALLSRKPAQKSNGLVSLTRTTDITLPEQTLSVAVGSIVSARLTGVQYRVTTTTAYIQTFFDNELGLYTLLVPVESVLPGLSGNASENTITILETPITGFTGVTNKQSFTNAIAQETDDDLVSRIKTRYESNNKGSGSGYKSLVLDNIVTVSDVSIVQAGDPEMTRDRGMGGMVDIYLKETFPAIAQENYSYNGETLQQLQNLPVTSIISVTGDNAGNPNYVFVDGVDYTLLQDTSLITKNSSAALDQLQWLGATVPNVGVGIPNYTVTVDYDANIETVQSLVDDPEQKILNANVLVKQANNVEIDISFTFFAETGYSKTILVPLIQDAIESFVGDLKIGETLFQSNIIEEVEKINGVRNVSLPLSLFNRTGDLAVVDSINPGRNSIITLGTLTVA